MLALTVLAAIAGAVEEEEAEPSDQTEITGKLPLGTAGPSKVFLTTTSTPETTQPTESPGAEGYRVGALLFGEQADCMYLADPSQFEQ